MSRFTIEIDDGGVRAALDRLAAAGTGLRPAMQDIGELLVERIKGRFATGTAPDGTPWAPNAPVTVERHRGRGPKRPLIGESRRLGNEIAVIASDNQVEVGSSLVYARVQQLGAARGQFGANKSGAPIPWGNIPARPFIGISERDRTDIVDILTEHLQAAIEG